MTKSSEHWREQIDPQRHYDIYLQMYQEHIEIHTFSGKAATDEALWQQVITHFKDHLHRSLGDTISEIQDQAERQKTTDQAGLSKQIKLLEKLADDEDPYEIWFDEWLSPRQNRIFEITNHELLGVTAKLSDESDATHIKLPKDHECTVTANSVFNGSSMAKHNAKMLLAQRDDDSAFWFAGEYSGLQILDEPITILTKKFELSIGQSEFHYSEVEAIKIGNQSSEIEFVNGSGSQGPQAWVISVD